MLTPYALTSCITRVASKRANSTNMTTLFVLIAVSTRPRTIKSIFRIDTFYKISCKILKGKQFLNKMYHTINELIWIKIEKNTTRSFIFRIISLLEKYYFINIPVLYDTCHNKTTFIKVVSFNVYNHHSLVFSNRFDILLHIALSLCHKVRKIDS